MMLTGFRKFGLAAAAMLGSMAPFAVSALAAEGRAENWQLGFQPAATPIAEQIHGFHNLVLVIITAITVFVLGLLIWVMVRYNEKANPVPSKTSHNSVIEVAWTIIPVLILLVIAVPSFRLLYAQYDFPKADLTVKVTGHQWYWSYSYPEHAAINFDSLVAEESDPTSDKYLLAVDNEMVVPVNKVVHMLVTSDDVIHDWAVPSFGIKTDAVKGRNSLTWFKAERPGIYYGECSELCGARHAYMPIAVRVVSEQEFASWVASKEKTASAGQAPAETLARNGVGKDGAGRQVATAAGQ
jgi:cytochrome c oxidase subunit II